MKNNFYFLNNLIQTWLTTAYAERFPYLYLKIGFRTIMIGYRLFVYFSFKIIFACLFFSQLWNSNKSI
jgi:hypothetical protein